MREERSKQKDGEASCQSECWLIPNPVRARASNVKLLRDPIPVCRGNLANPLTYCLGQWGLDGNLASDWLIITSKIAHIILAQNSKRI